MVRCYTYPHRHESMPTPHLPPLFFSHAPTDGTMHGHPHHCHHFKSHIAGSNSMGKSPLSAYVCVLTPTLTTSFCSYAHTVGTACVHTASSASTWWCACTTTTCTQRETTTTCCCGLDATCTHAQTTKMHTPSHEMTTQCMHTHATHCCQLDAAYAHQHAHKTTMHAPSHSDMRQCCITCAHTHMPTDSNDVHTLTRYDNDDNVCHGVCRKEIVET